MRVRAPPAHGCRCAAQRARPSSCAPRGTARRLNAHSRHLNAPPRPCRWRPAGAGELPGGGPSACRGDLLSNGFFDGARLDSVANAFVMALLCSDACEHCAPLATRKLLERAGAGGAAAPVCARMCTLPRGAASQPDMPCRWNWALAALPPAPLTHRHPHPAVPLSHPTHSLPHSHRTHPPTQPPGTRPRQRAGRRQQQVQRAAVRGRGAGALGPPWGAERGGARGVEPCWGAGA